VGNFLGTTTTYLQRTTSTAAGSGLGSNINEHSTTMHNERQRGQLPGHHDHVFADHVFATHNERRRGQRPGATIKYLRCTTSAAAGSGLGTKINEHSTTMHKERRREQLRGQNDHVSATHNEHRPPRAATWAPK
jgi:hypothetical protein